MGCTCVGAAQEAFVEQYNDQLRELREAGLTEEAEEVREALRALRDEERAPEASVKVHCSLCRLLKITLHLFTTLSWLPWIVLQVVRLYK